MMLCFRNDDARAELAALDRSQAVIEFRPDGTILSANANFLTAMGYALPEVQGRHHGLVVEPAHRDGAEYRTFWEALRLGEPQIAVASGRVDQATRQVREAAHAVG